MTALLVGIFSGLAVLITSVLKVISNIHSFFFSELFLFPRRQTTFKIYDLRELGVYFEENSGVFLLGWTNNIYLLIYYSSSFLYHAWFYLYVIRKLCHCPLDGRFCFFGDFHKNGVSLKTQMSILSKTIYIDKYSTDYFHYGIKKIYVLLNFGVFKTKHCCICLIIN